MQKHTHKFLSNINLKIKKLVQDKIIQNSSNNFKLLYKPNIRGWKIDVLYERTCQ